MAKINGTTKDDRLIGTAGDDEIDGGRGHDWIEGRGGNDVLTGGEGRDTFVFRADSGHDVITDFNVGVMGRNGQMKEWNDQVLLDGQTGVWDGYLGGRFGFLYDGYEIYNSQDTLVATLRAIDYDGDGDVDSQFVMASGATLTLLDVEPTQLTGYMLFGG